VTGKTGAQRARPSRRFQGGYKVRILATNLSLTYSESVSVAAFEAFTTG